MQIVRTAVFLLFAALLPAQTFRGNITGIVTDASGAAIPEAAVKLESPSTGLTRTAATNAQGEYSFPDLAVGVYAITVSHTGFESRKFAGVEVAVSKTTNLDVQLGVARQQQVIEVSATAATLDTTATALVGVVDTKTVADLPMNGRDFRQMIKLAPGVSPASTSVNGMRTSGNNYQIDGADNNDAFQNAAAVNQGGVSGIAGTLLPIEAIDQFSVQSNASAEVGRNPGSMVNVVIKSGTNQLHGSAYYFNRNEALAAHNPFAPPGSSNPLLRNENYGFSVGGPIIKNKTFFFITYEKQKFTAGNTAQATVPSSAWINQAEGLLSKYGVPVNQVMLNVYGALWPSSIAGAALTQPNYFSNDPQKYKSDNGVIKLDHAFTSRQN